MKLNARLVWTLVVMCIAFASVPAFGCTNFLITRGASADGSVMVTYAADSHQLYGELYYTPAGEHIPGSMIDIYEWDTGKYLGQIRQAEVTYSVVGNMNEHQVVIGETTYGGRKELKDPNGILDYGSLMYIALQRSRTARQAIEIMGQLVEEYGYYSSGESFSVADQNEAWIMEMIGKGEKNRGAVWVARRIPDGYVSAHANQARIQHFPLHDSVNCLYAGDVISFAREKGYYSGKDKDFRFADTYAPVDFGALRFCEARVWSMFRRIAPSLKISPDYVMGDTRAKPLPLWIKPDKKVSVREVMELMRDHFEDSPMDLTLGVGAGPYNCPYRWRPLTWKVDGKEYFNERATSTQQTGFSFVAQCRNWLPDPVGGLFWFSVDDTNSTVYVPIYCGIEKIPPSYAVNSGNFNEFSWDSAFWVFNFVSNYSYLRYSDMIKDIKKVQRELESRFMAETKKIDVEAKKLFTRSPRQAREYLSEYSVSRGEQVTRRWKKLGEFLIYKYLDGNRKDELGKVKHPGYSKAWYRRIVKESGDRYQVRKEEKNK